jgi:hypothetical protein
MVTYPFGLSTAAAVYLGYTWVCWNYLFIHFTVSHTHLGTVDKVVIELHKILICIYIPILYLYSHNLTFNLVYLYVLRI